MSRRAPGRRTLPDDCPWHMAEADDLGLGRRYPSDPVCSGSWQKVSPCLGLGHIPILHLVTTFLSHISLGRFAVLAANVPMPSPLQLRYPWSLNGFIVCRTQRLVKETVCLAFSPPLLWENVGSLEI